MCLLLKLFEEERSKKMSKLHEITFSPRGEAFTSTKNGDHARSILELGERVPLATNLWLVVGEMPEDNINHPDIANALIYRAGDRLYLLDSGAGPTFRQSIMQVLQEVGPVQSFSLLNSHVHIDHNANNDLIHLAQARETHHYLSEAGLTRLDPFSYFAVQFAQLGVYHDVMKGFQTHRVLMQFVGALRDVLAVFVGERRALELLFHIMLRNFQPIRASRETIQPYESLPRQPLMIGDVPWTGWVLGINDVWVLEARGHTPDEVLFYIPEHQVLHTADVTFAPFPTLPDSDGGVIRETLSKCQAMARAGAVRLLTDGHHHQVYRGQQEIISFLETLLTEQEQFQTVLKQILEEYDGLSVEQIYATVRERQGEPAVQHYLSLESPHTPFTLQDIIIVTLLQMGYEARGPRRKKRFYRPVSTT
jgi:glyoxylase-like metal-dependent hydrolase (beta-lactamase superfamily II)